MRKLQYKLTNDILFKMIFVKYPELLKKLVAELLSIEYTSIEQFNIRNPEMHQNLWEINFVDLILI